MRVQALVGNIASGIFGPEYADVIEEEVGAFDIEGTTDIVYAIAPSMKMSLLPPGGYVIRYIEGSYLLLKESPTKFVVGGEKGAQVRWSSADARDWTSAPLAIGDEKDEPTFTPSSGLHELSYIEFTKPHRLQMVPPKDSVGSIKIRIVRYVPRHLSEWTAENMIEAVK